MAGSSNLDNVDAGQQASKVTQGCGCLIFVILLTVFLGYCSDNSKDIAGPDQEKDQVLNIENEIATKTIYNGDTASITANALNARTEPSTLASTGHKFSKGETVEIIEKRKGWLKVRKDGKDLWIAGKHVSKNKPVLQDITEPRYTSNKREPSSKATRSSNLRSNRRKNRGSAKQFGIGRGTTSGSCPCNGGAVCVGPRGGRYCITSGGNKRYGV